jgi:ADP-heptose:LPS heptosyltransferase
MNFPLFIRRFAKRLLYLPISPRAFALQVRVLRAIGFLRQPIHCRSGEFRKIFLAHPYSSVGDMVLLLPLLEKIHEVWPSANIDIVSGNSACHLLSGIDGLRNVFVCGSHRSRFGVFGIYKRLLRNLLLYRREMMQYEYDLAIAPRWGSILTSEAVYLAYLTGAPERIGYSGSVDGGDESINVLLTRAANGGQHEHETIRNIRLLERVKLTRLEPEDESVSFRPIQSLVRLAKQTPVEQLFNKFHSGNRLAPQGYAVIAPGATNPYNIWPSGFLADVIQKLHQENALYFYIVGGSGDAHRCEEVAQLVPEYARSIAGKTNLQELAGLVSRARLFIGMDSGIAHIAGGLGIPTIVISPFPSSFTEDHPHSPERFRPCGPYVSVLQPESPIPPCDPICSAPGPHCIQQVTPAQVVAASISLLSRKSYAGV